MLLGQAQNELFSIFPKISNLFIANEDCPRIFTCMCLNNRTSLQNRNRFFHTRLQNLFHFVRQFGSSCIRNSNLCYFFILQTYSQIIDPFFKVFTPRPFTIGCSSCCFICITTRIFRSELRSPVTRPMRPPFTRFSRVDTPI